MPKSILLHLSGCSGCDNAIDQAVTIAQISDARLRGLSVTDAKEEPGVGQAISAAHVLSDACKLAHKELRQSMSHDYFQEVASRQGIDYAAWGTSGDPVECLIREAQFHDLLFLCCPVQSLQTPRDLTPWRHVELAARSRLPTYVSRGNTHVAERVLLVYDGTEASALAIRTFLADNPLPYARCRLLGVGAAADYKAQRFRSMREYCHARRNQLEVGCLTGPVRRVLMSYAEKWEADTMVLGIPQNFSLWSRLTGEFSLSVLQRSELDLYLVG